MAPPASVRRIGGIAIQAIDGDAAVAQVAAAIAARDGTIFAFCNQHGFNLAQRQPDFANALDRMTVFNDGVAIDVASRILFGEAFPANLNGTDLTPRVLEALPSGTRVFLLGSAPGVAARAAEALAARSPNIVIAGAEHGFFDETESADLTARIRDADSALVLLGMGNPRQELWAARHAAATGAVVMCIGAFLDFAAGAIPRAPRWVRAARAEWAYRLAREPRRMTRRYVGGALPFLAAVLRERFSRRKGG